MPELSIILPTMNRPLIFEQTLFSLLDAVSKVPFSTEVIVVNDSKTAVPNLSSKQNNLIQLIHNPGQGVASARNYGAKHAQGEYLLFMDDDILVKSENLIRTFEFLKKYPNHVYASNWNYPQVLADQLQPSAFGRYLIKNGYVSLEGWENSPLWDPNHPFECKSVAATYLPIAKKSFDQVGGFDETYPFAGFEDYDISVRLIKSGIHLFIDPLNLVYHNEADRLDLKLWMIRKRRSAQTRRVGVERGYKEAAVVQHSWKYAIYYINRPLANFWVNLVKLIPNSKLFDPLYFKFVNFLLGLNLHIGYFHSKKIGGYL